MVTPHHVEAMCQGNINGMTIVIGTSITTNAIHFPILAH